MKHLLLPFLAVAIACLAFATALFAQKKPAAVSLAYDPYPGYPVYNGTDLGVNYSPAATVVNVWSPPAEAMQVRLYRASTGGDPVEEIPARREKDGVWKADLPGDRNGLYYTIRVQIAGKWLGETPDPYARAVGVNGQRGQIVNFRETDPPGWENDQAPALKQATDAVIYELHIRDLSMDPGSGIDYKGKYSGLAESATVNRFGQKTGIDHIAALGVTHVHLLPVFDFATVDESKPEVPQFNWGYDPQNYNVPEGSYATVAADGRVRIREFKEMVQALHRKGLRVVMDVVYNHTSTTGNSVFDQLVPGYYYRQWEKDGTYSNASGCGNETASERAMMRKFIIESVTGWVKEYHIDGFRFDLMAIHDIETMNRVSAALHAIDPSILIYGEGWTAGDSPLPAGDRALKASVQKLDGIAVFSDDIRDAIKGSVFDDKSTGFASGNNGMKESVKFGIVAAGQHPQVDYSQVAYSKAPYATRPGQVINYVACHDNHTLYDKLKVSRPDASEADLVKMHKLANTIVMTSQGIPFLHAGEEMKRTKGGEHNSFNKPDSVNRIDWSWKHTNSELVEYYTSLIALRRAHPAFRMPDAAMVRQHLQFLPGDDPQVIAYRLTAHANRDLWEEIVVIFNGSPEIRKVDLPAGTWKTALKEYRFTTGDDLTTGPVPVAPISAMILYR
ncbi:MAG TPA: type I pullulanase [Bacteroidales bacterium]|nr:type I pullulanase [Bacteroidales bacterium]